MYMLKPRFSRYIHIKIFGDAEEPSHETVEHNYIYKDVQDLFVISGFELYPSHKLYNAFCTL